MGCVGGLLVELPVLLKNGSKHVNLNKACITALLMFLDLSLLFCVCTYLETAPFEESPSMSFTYWNIHVQTTIKH